MKRKDTYTRGNVVVDVVRSNSEVCLILDLKINGVPAYLFDFGSMVDLSKETAPPSGCGDRSFVPNCERYTGEILRRYNLTEDDADDLMWILVNRFHIGYCKRCR